MPTDLPAAVPIPAAESAPSSLSSPASPGLLLVTGGAGFIGSAIVAAALDAGWRVRVLDSLRDDVHASTDLDTADAPAVTRDPRVDFIRGDVTDPAAVAAALDGVTVVCHQAAKVGLGVDFLDAPDYVASNELGTAILLAEMTRANIDRFVLASSMVVYGEGSYRRSSGAPTRADAVTAAIEESISAPTEPSWGGNRLPDPVAGAGVAAGADAGSGASGEAAGAAGTSAPTEAERPPARRVDDLEAGRFDPVDPATGLPLVPALIAEDDPLDPRNVYASSKLSQEYLAASWARTTGGRALALRYHNVYGPGMPQNTPYAGVASLFRSAIERGEAPRVFEDGRQRRDFVHVADVASANLAAIARSGTAEPATFRAFNVGSGTVHTIGDLAEALSRLSGGQPPVVTGEFRLGDVRHITASNERLRTELGWSPRVSFEEGVREFASAPLRAAVTPRAQPQVPPLAEPTGAAGVAGVAALDALGSTTAATSAAANDPDTAGAPGAAGTPGETGAAQ